MGKTQLYSSGLELANFVVTLDIFHDAWTAIWSLYTEISQNEGPSSFVRFKVYELPNYTIIAFFTWPSSSKDSVQGGGGGNLVSSSTFKGSFPLFDFLCPRPKDPDNQKNKPKDDPSFSINETAFQLFKSIFGVLPKFEIDNSKQLIITGNSLGGSVATLFTLSLLEKFNFSKNKGPLCITFGSPLIGDENLQEAISKYAAWNSRFLHVVSDQDVVPRVLINGYQPFGTFLFCSKLGCSCFEDHQTILELLTATNSGTPENEDPNKVFESYGTFVKDLNRKVICKDTTDHESLIDWTTTPLRAGIITQLAAIGLVQSQQQENIVITKTEQGVKKMAFLNQQAFDPTRGLNDIKVYMAYLEQYKKVSKDERVGYYDRYKNKLDTSDIKVEEHMRRLTYYWEDMVDQAEKRPQTVGASLRTRSLFGGTNYRRMIEPLDIADYYKAGKQDYINQGRSKHYIILEQLLKETEKPSSGPNKLKKQNVASSLTEDSCFWAHVEEARISCQLLSSGESSDEKKDSAKKELIEFEKYVFDLMKNYAVSSEIFLPGSSFMKWWGEYREITGASYSSRLTNLLKNENNYEAYANGSLEFPLNFV
ncbi:senescence-associated carboxylesterase 101-like [Quercus robur]|uniref:senescence-associated carboxylesterase 101-like n=1 Tax=Quercus robur TaxID=38942 RepID=UPI0021623F38|nr:senescence-associated carboxylesterase 101-like [Quercus robur]